MQAACCLSLQQHCAQLEATLTPAISYCVVENCSDALVEWPDERGEEVEVMVWWFGWLVQSRPDHADHEELIWLQWTCEIVYMEEHCNAMEIL